jgi:integrase
MEKMGRGGIWYRWKTYCPEHRVHDARHSFGTLLLEASGGNLRVVQKALGHSRITTTTVYADVVDEKTRESMKAMDHLARSTMKSLRNPQPGRLAMASVEEDHTEPDWAPLP